MITVFSAICFQYFHDFELYSLVGTGDEEKCNRGSIPHQEICRAGTKSSRDIPRAYEALQTRT